MKLDIEGMEYRVLAKYFHEAPESMFPGFVIAEFFPQWTDRAGGDVVALLKRVGYRCEQISSYNWLATRTAA